MHLIFSQDQLRATCAAFNQVRQAPASLTLPNAPQAYVEDPSNEYEYQLRARSRVFVDKLAEQGFNTDELLPLIECAAYLCMLALTDRTKQTHRSLARLCCREGGGVSPEQVHRRHTVWIRMPSASPYSVPPPL